MQVMRELRDEKLDFWITNNFNVLFIGHYGSGKTTRILDAFKRNNLNFKYFSAATMDPWCDFVGVPKVMSDEKGAYLDYVLPRDLRDDTIEAIYMDEFNRCLSGDTLIQLADGCSIKIKDLVGKSHFYVYSYDLKEKKIVVAKGHSARVTGRKESLIKVTLDNGESVKTTSDHPFLTRDGEYVKAIDLKIGDSLMPIYKKLSENEKLSLNGYEQVFQIEKNKWEFTHRLADEYNLLNCIYEKSCGKVRHHKDYNKLNNNPENIERLTWSKHKQLHKNTGRNGGIAAHKKHPNLYDKTLGKPESKSLALSNSIKTRQTSKKYKILRSDLSKKINGTKQRREQQSSLCKAGWGTGQFSFDQQSAHKKQKKTIVINFGYNILKIYGNINEEIYELERNKIKGKKKSTIIKLNNIANYFGSFEEYVKILKNNNHKIVKIELTNPEDVYDISVEEYHNFALGVGVFVHNSHKKVRNAVMELLQFKSINGRPFKNLRLIWAAINPDEEGDYQVEALDKAQKDRFQIQISMPYEPNLEYFSNKFNIKQAKVAVNWWQSLSSELQMEVSPRRLEYALQMFNIPGGNIRDVLPHESNPSKLNSLLKTGPIDDRMKEMLAANDVEGAKKFFQVENNYASAVKQIVKEIPADEDHNAWKLFFLQAIPMEKLSVMMNSDEDAYNFIIANCDKAPNFQRSISDILAVNIDKILVRRIKKELDNNPALSSLFTTKPSAVEKAYYSNRPANMPWNSKLAGWLIQPMDITPDRIRIYDEIVDWIPKTLSLNDAVGTLELINMLASRSQMATLKQYKHLVGVVNHCIEQINKASGLSWSEILTNYGQKMNRLLSKMKDSNMHLGILHPVKKVS